MALVNCFDCGTPISVNADRCPKCGTMDTPMARRDAEKEQWVREKVQEMRGNPQAQDYSDVPLWWKVVVSLFLLFCLILAIAG